MRYVLLITDMSYLYGRSFLVNEYGLINKKIKKQKTNQTAVLMAHINNSGHNVLLEPASFPTLYLTAYLSWLISIIIGSLLRSEGPHYLVTGLGWTPLYRVPTQKVISKSLYFPSDSKFSRANFGNLK